MSLYACAVTNAFQMQPKRTKKEFVGEIAKVETFFASLKQKIVVYNYNIELAQVYGTKIVQPNVEKYHNVQLIYKL